MRIISTLWITLLVALLPNFAAAQSFNCITNNGACTAAESDLTWSFSGNSLTINNNIVAGNNSFIGGIYFDYSAGMGVSLVSPTGTVDFVQGGSPGHLPGDNQINPTFVADAYWTTGLNPVSTYGVNAGESITFNLSGVTAANFSNGSIRVGIHLQGLPGGASESLVSAVPEPETYAMLLAGLGLIGFTARRRRQMTAND